MQLPSLEVTANSIIWSITIISASAYTDIYTIFYEYNL